MIQFNFVDFTGFTIDLKWPECTRWPLCWQRPWFNPLFNQLWLAKTRKVQGQVSLLQTTHKPHNNICSDNNYMNGEWETQCWFASVGRWWLINGPRQLDGFARVNWIIVLSGSITPGLIVIVCPAASCRVQSEAMLCHLCLVNMVHMTSCM